jgi:accessory colonization factor AcfC
LRLVLDSRSSIEIDAAGRTAHRETVQRLRKQIYNFSRTSVRDYTPKEKAKITAGAVAALVIVGWLAIVVLAILSTG